MSNRKYYCICEANCKFETMTKEQILAAIAQAAESGLVFDTDAAYITKVQESNAGKYITFWIGTQAQYNALATKEENCLYIITDNDAPAKLDEAMLAAQAAVDEAQAAETAAAEAKAFTIAAAYGNGLLTDALDIDLYDRFAEKNKPQLVDGSSANCPADLDAGIREVFFISPKIGYYAVKITGLDTEARCGVWLNLRRANGWYGWQRTQDETMLETAIEAVHERIDTAFETEYITCDALLEGGALRQISVAIGDINACIGTPMVSVQLKTYEGDDYEGCFVTAGEPYIFNSDWLLPVTFNNKNVDISKHPHALIGVMRQKVRSSTAG